MVAFSKLTGESPWCDDFDIRLKAVECELETNLVVPFARTTMGYEAVALNITIFGQKEML